MYVKFSKPTLESPIVMTADIKTKVGDIRVVKVSKEKAYFVLPEQSGLENVTVIWDNPPDQIEKGIIDTVIGFVGDAIDLGKKIFGGGGGGSGGGGGGGGNSSCSNISVTVSGSGNTFNSGSITINCQNPPPQ